MGRHFGGWRVPVRATHRASAVSPPLGARRGRGAGRVCFPEFFAGPVSWNLAQELSFKLAPRVKETVSGKDVSKTRGVKRPGLDELEKPRFILGAPGLECDGGEVFGSEDTRRGSIHVFAQGFA